MYRVSSIGLVTHDTPHPHPLKRLRLPTIYTFVGCYLATQVFFLIPSCCRPMMKGVMGRQNSYNTLSGVHSTMHLVHPN